MKKLLFITPFLGRGGMERSLGLLLKDFNYKKYEVLVLYFQKLYSDSETSFLEEVLREKNIKVYFRTYRRGLSIFKVSKIIFEVVKRENPHMIIAREWFAIGVSVLVKKLFFSRSPLKVMGVFTNNPEWEFLHHLHAQPWYMVEKFFYTRLIRHAQKIVCISKGLQKKVQEIFDVPPGNTVLIYNGVDEDFIKTIAEKRSQVPTILSVGRFSPEKDWPTLLRTFQKVRKNISCQLWIIGYGELESDLQRLARELGIADSIRWLGYQPNPYIFMKQATIFLSSSLFEGFGNVILEAMACGLPVVSTNCSFGPAETILHGKTGFLARAEDDDALSQYVLCILGDGELCRKISESAKKRAHDFSLTHMREEYERLVFET